ncbi:Phycocyanin [Gemmatirosa kalamazoonensis]|uniref:Phycocyanin n=1 Tax=Gemmatirosa kalamazoonensis TaxID=861299 RepID=W0R9N5_9BACT|nr:hypothetical protein [Gemmatirosa kalamazoonensis]AHG87804.1 Phycocyanin [Gemmatirosa kalamazoonensis]
MDAVTPSAEGRAASRLLAQKTELAHAVTEAMYAERPELLERYGETGRARCLEDLHFTLEHLVPAVDLGDASMFAGYVRWLDALLRARGVPTRDVLRSLELVEREVRARFPDDEADAVAPYVRAGIEVVT